MYVIIVYDVEVERVGRIRKFLKTYLYWRQNSVFEGEISRSGLEKIKMEIKKIVDEGIDSVIIYKFGSKKNFDTEIIGVEKNPIDTVL